MFRLCTVTHFKRLAVLEIIINVCVILCLIYVDCLFWEYCIRDQVQMLPVEKLGEPAAHCALMEVRKLTRGVSAKPTRCYSSLKTSPM